MALCVFIAYFQRSVFLGFTFLEILRVFLHFFFNLVFPRVNFLLIPNSPKFGVRIWVIS